MGRNSGQFGGFIFFELTQPHHEVLIVSTIYPTAFVILFVLFNRRKIGSSRKETFFMNFYIIPLFVIVIISLVFILLPWNGAFS